MSLEELPSYQQLRQVALWVNGQFQEAYQFVLQLFKKLLGEPNPLAEIMSLEELPPYEQLIQVTLWVDGQFQEVYQSILQLFKKLLGEPNPLAEVILELESLSALIQNRMSTLQSIYTEVLVTTGFCESASGRKALGPLVFVEDYSVLVYHQSLLFEAVQAVFLKLEEALKESAWTMFIPLFLTTQRGLKELEKIYEHLRAQLKERGVSAHWETQGEPSNQSLWMKRIAQRLNRSSNYR